VGTVRDSKIPLQSASENLLEFNCKYMLKYCL
jgi:hypothetical protein